MKKLLAVMLSLAMLLTAAAFAEEADLLGIWYLTGVGTEVGTYSPADFGMSMSIELNEDGTFKLSLRSKGDADVNKVGRALGGGGHVKAAGATLNMPLAEALKRTKSEMTAELSRL